MSNKKEITSIVIDGVEMVPKGSDAVKLVPVQSGTIGVWEIGKKYLVRTVTYHLIGRLVNVDNNELLFDSASWLASSGRFNEALRTGNLSEVEPFVKPVIVGRGSLIDATEWDHVLPTKVK